jgi:hypothetical protein
MSDTYHTLTVVLEQDITVESATALMHAIGQMRGILKVSGHVADITSHMAEERAHRELAEKLWTILCQKNDR